uniref:GATA zinc finger domain-containing protein 7-like n=1 Tax=Dermatophagoides pteronyssinus TaxID=6956 RepID=A0A6P6YAJ1_DERPT|nr:GATA zinc finger domain-containing protein 7-like [Dermatophagoides pteronyssinus]
MPANLLCDFADIISSTSTMIGNNNNVNGGFFETTIGHNNNNDLQQQQQQRRTFSINDDCTTNDFSNEFNQWLQMSDQQQQQQSNNMNQLRSSTVNSLLNALNNINGNNNNNHHQNNDHQMMLKAAIANATPVSTTTSATAMTMKRSQNTTECVPVPSSEHVAEIVGRQGCKIKALRAKTNTYIKTPVRNEEPVFVVTGRKEDVNAAKREILSAAEHFSQIRAQRKNNPGNMGPAPNAHLPGHITIQVRVPYRVVGLVVGPKGATIKRIQQQTNTYIITPSREKDPVFEVTGLSDDVDTARKEIEAHIAFRTGGIIDSQAGSIGTPDESTTTGTGSDFSNSPLLSSFDNLFISCLTNNKCNDFFLSSSSAAAASTTTTTSTTKSSFLNHSPSMTTKLMGNNNSLIHQQQQQPSLKSQTFKELCSIFHMNDPHHHSSLSASPPNSLTSGQTSNGSYDIDEGLGDSPTSFDHLLSIHNNNKNNVYNSLSSMWPSSSNESSTTSSTRTGSFQLIDDYNNDNSFLISNNNNNNIETSLMMITNNNNNMDQRRSSLESNIPNNHNHLSLASVSASPSSLSGIGSSSII